MSLRLLLILLVALGAAVPAGAGLLDRRPPSLAGQQPSRIVYRVGPVYYYAGRVDTVVRCTNVSSAAIGIAMEIFDEQDALAALIVGGSLATGATVVFATAASAEFPDATVSADLAAIDHGKARISATTSRIACDAVHVFYGMAAGPAKISPLRLVKKIAVEGEPKAKKKIAVEGEPKAATKRRKKKDRL